LVTYDVKKSTLVKKETKKFVQDTLGNLGFGDKFSENDFDKVFSTFDKDGSGTVEKSEMVAFVKQLLGN
jgi:Ca2+-binding EF-hand superfamily protein